MAHNFTKIVNKCLDYLCTVQVLLGLGNLSALWNMGVSAFQGFDCTQTYVNAFLDKTKFFRGVHKSGFHCIQDLKSIKNVKGCRDGMPKSMQTR